MSIVANAAANAEMAEQFYIDGVPIEKLETHDLGAELMARKRPVPKKREFMLEALKTCLREEAHERDRMPAMQKAEQERKYLAVTSKRLAEYKKIQVGGFWCLRVYL